MDSMTCLTTYHPLSGVELFLRDMKRCPECRRDYYDDTLHYCLDDGAELLEGPASADDPATAVFQPENEGATRVFDQPSARDGTHKRNLILAITLGVAVVATLGIGGYIYYGRGPAKQIESIAVMPFVNASGNPDMEYLSDGVTHMLISSLSPLSGLSVKAPSSVFRYKGKEADAQTIGSELNVQTILNGRVVQRGDDLTLYLSLVDTKTENEIWGKQYRGKLTNLIGLQSEIAQDVAENLKPRLSGGDEQSLAKKETHNAEALKLYMLGRFFWNKRSQESIKKAIEYFDQAIALDPNYARAYAGLAGAYALYFESGRPESGRENRIKAREAAEKALRLDDELAEARASLGYILASDYDFRGAERELQRAIALDPNYATAHHWYGNLLSRLGRYEEAIFEGQRSLELEPFSPVMNASLGVTFTHAGRYDDAMAYYRKALDLDPNYSGAYGNIGAIYWLKKDYSQAVEYFAKQSDVAGRHEEATALRESFANGGWPGYLRYRLDGSASRSPYQLAATYLGLGDKDEAFRQLNRSFELREAALTFVQVDPRLDGLRDDPRYHDLLKKIGLPLD